MNVELDPPKVMTMEDADAASTKSWIKRYEDTHPQKSGSNNASSPPATDASGQTSTSSS